MIPSKLEQANLKLDDIAKARMRTAMQSPEHLAAWLDQSGRRYIVLQSKDLIEALKPGWPHTIDVLMGIIHQYTQYRRTQPSGETGEVEDPLTGEMVTTQMFKGDELTRPELDRAIRFLVAKMYEMDPTWKLEDPAL